jgi:hypothetical protein
MTFTKFVSIKNIGRFQNYNAAGDVVLKRVNLVFAENGRGKRFTIPSAVESMTFKASVWTQDLPHLAGAASQRYRRRYSGFE